MSDAEPGYTVQRLRGGFAIVQTYVDESGKIRRSRKQLQARDRPSAEAEARRDWAAAAGAPRTVAGLMSGYLASIAGKSSYQRRKDAWKAMAPFWSGVDPDLIDEQMCRAYRKSRPVADATARYELLQLSTALAWGRAEKKTEARPSIWLPSQPERKLRHLTRDEFDRFFAAVKADHARLYVMIGLHTCARPSAILDLTWDRVDFMRGTIDFTPPGHIRTAKRRGVVPIADELMPALQAGHAARSCEFVIERGGKRVSSLKKAFQAASERSNVHATPYTLRHTGAVWAAEAGVPMPQLAQFMGHDDDRTTQKFYARFSPGHLLNVANAIGKRA